MKGTCEFIRYLTRMIEVEPLVATTRRLAQEFLQMLCNRQVEALSAWLQRAHVRGIEALKSFFNGLENDFVAACVTCALPWSNGLPEGNVNRLKLIKRQIYGRTNFDLLRRRVLGMPVPPLNLFTKFDAVGERVIRQLKAQNRILGWRTEEPG